MDDRKPLREKFQIISERVGDVPEEHLNFILLKNYCISNDVVLSLPYHIKLALYKKLAAEQRTNEEEELN